MATSIATRSTFVVASVLATSLWHWIRDPLDRFTTPSSKVTTSSSSFFSPETKSTTTKSRTIQAEEDRILTLPGLPPPNDDDDDDGNRFEAFSGYLNVSPTRHVFYVYVESKRSPDDDPVFLWSNGGPGCSGLLAFGVEHGPYHVLDDLSLEANPYSWNSIANVLYIEQPAGVGFSYTDTVDDLITGDAQSASDNYQLILQFLERFPERGANDFFIASESYGGHYMPQLALEILDMDVDHVINFQGMVVGNPFVDPYTNTVSEINAYYSHGLLPKPLHDLWYSTCHDPATFDTPECYKVENPIYETVDTQGINPYALDYPICLRSQTTSSTSSNDHHNTRHLHQRYTDMKMEGGGGPPKLPLPVRSAQIWALKSHTKRPGQPPFSPKEDVYMPCSQSNLQLYMNRRDVQEAMHVHVPGSTWKTCGGVNYTAADVATSTISLYRELVDRAVAGNHSLRMLIYSGDDDSVCATQGTQDWLWTLGVDADPDLYWKAWKVEGQTAGFVTRFDINDGNVHTSTKIDRDSNRATLTFATVHGSGHEVPEYRPMEALHLLRNYLNGTWET